MSRTANLSPNSFRDTPLAELSFEEALIAGATRSAKLSSDDFTETSIRFSVPGLRNWYSTYCDLCSDHYSLRTVLRDAAWHWASYCSTDTDIAGMRTVFKLLRRSIAEQTGYDDLMDRLRDAPYVNGFTRPERFPTNAVVPREAFGIITEIAGILDLSFSKFYQVGLAWSLSRSKDRMFPTWVTDVAEPLIDQVRHAIVLKMGRLAEVSNQLEYLLENPRSKIILPPPR